MTVIKTPFTIAPSGKVAVEKVSENIVAQKIKDFILTKQYERPMLPSYGANTHYLLFENFDELTFEEYKVETMRELNNYISGAQIVGMAVRPSNPNSLFTESDGAITIEVSFRLPLGGIRTTEINYVSPLNINEDFRI